MCSSSVTAEEVVHGDGDDNSYNILNSKFNGRLKYCSINPNSQYYVNNGRLPDNQDFNL